LTGRRRRFDPAPLTNNYDPDQTSSRFEPDRRNQLNCDPLQLFHFDNQGAACLGFRDHRPLLEKSRSNPDFERLVGACNINGETIALELERGRNATGSLVQNLRTGFVPPEPPNRTSRYFCDRYGRLGAIACGEAELRYNTLAG
jgi:hypothetical protein